MYATIELMQPVSADDPQIASGDEASPLIEDLVPRFDRDVRGSMQYPPDRLPRRLAPLVEHADDPAEQGSAPATLCRCVDQFVNRAMAQSQR